jgi:hypothetical protein
MLIKKILGVLMILLGIILSIPTVRGLLNVIGMTKNNNDKLGHSLGYLIWQLFMCFIIYLLIRFGIKFLKK